MIANEHSGLPPEVDDFIINQASPSTAKGYEREIRLLMQCLDKPLEEITSRDLIAYRRTLTGIKPATVSRKLSVIRSLFKFLAQGGYRNDNPAQVLKLPKHVNVSPYRILTADELKLLLEQPDRQTPVGIRDYAILLILAVNALREAELINIEKDDISKVNGYSVAVIRGKGSKVRVSKITGVVADALEAWLEIHTTPTGPLFVAVSGNSITARRISTRSIRYRVKKYALMAGITRKVSPHALRHAAITHALANGANILKVKEMAGHSSLTTTQRYLHDLDSMKNAAVDFSPLNKSDNSNSNSNH